MARFFTVAVALLAMVAITVMANEAEAPIPEGYELPVINHPINSNRGAREKVRVLANLVASEPDVVKNFEKESALAAAAAAEDTWNGEEDPEGNHNLKHQADLKEMKALQKLIIHGKKILRVLPHKIKRLNALKAKAAHFLKAKAKRQALEKLEKQEALLNAIRSKEAAVAKRLKTLKSSQNKLSGSIKRIRKILTNKPKKAAAKNKKQPKVAPRTAAKGKSFIEAEASGEAESQTEAEAEADAQVQAEGEAAAEEAINNEAEAPQTQAEEEFNLTDM